MITMKCAKCGNAFTPNGSSYCSIGHKRQHERQLKSCASPEKKVYASAEAAWEYIDSRPDDKLFKTNLRPYSDCTCKRFHIAHGEPNKYSRVNA